MCSKMMIGAVTALVTWWCVTRILWSQAFPMTSHTTGSCCSIHRKTCRSIRLAVLSNDDEKEQPPVPTNQKQNEYQSTMIQSETKSIATSNDINRSRQQQKQQLQPEVWTGDPYEPVPFPSFRLDLTPKSKLPISTTGNPLWMAIRGLFIHHQRRRWKDNNNNNVVLYFENESSSSIMAKLWRIVVEGKPMVAVFPRAKHAITIRQFVDLLDFLHQNVPNTIDDNDNDSNSIPLLEASYETMDGFPAIRFIATPTASPKYLQQQQHQQQPQQPVPNPMMTGTSRTLESTTTNYDISPKTIERRIQAWVNRVLVQMQICPFTKSVKYSGQGVPNIPVAKIAYHTSNASTVAQVLADAWQAMDDMLVAGPMEISSILLAVPNFDHQFRLWAGPVFTILEHSIIAAQATNELGVVCFHPQYQTPDGTTFPGFGHMHSVTRLQRWSGINDRGIVAAGGAWQRRTPHAVINVLRADQLVAAEPLRNTPKLYRDNIQKLMAMADELPMALAREQQLE